MAKKSVIQNDAAGLPPGIGYDKIPLLVQLLFAGYVVTWFLQLGSRISFLGAIRFEFLVGVSLIGIALFTSRQRMPKTGVAPYLVLFFLALITQIPFSYNVEYSWLIFYNRVVKFACLAFFIIVYVRTPLALRLLICALIFAWLKIGQEELIGRITGSLVWENQGIMRLNGTTGLFSHPTSLSGLGLGMTPFILYLFPIANKWGKLILLVLLVFALNIIIYCGARTAYVGFLFFCALIFWRSKHKGKFIGVGLLVALVALQLIPQQYIGRFESITGQEAEGHSKLRRLEILADAVVIFKEHPFGVGVSAFPTIREQRFGRTQDTHNLYMEVLTNLGIQGFILWALFIAAIWRVSRRLGIAIDEQLETLQRFKDPGGELPPHLRAHFADLTLYRAMLNAITAYLLIRLVVGFFGMDLYEIYWWLVLGTVVALHNLTHVAQKITLFYVEKEPPPADSAAPPEPLRRPKEARPAGAFALARANGRHLRLQRKS